MDDDEATRFAATTAHEVSEEQEAADEVRASLRRGSDAAVERVKSAELRGFDDASNWLLSGADPEDFMRHHQPPNGLPGCQDCEAGEITANDCPRCAYELGFAEGESK